MADFVTVVFSPRREILQQHIPSGKIRLFHLCPFHPLDTSQRYLQFPAIGPGNRVGLGAELRGRRPDASSPRETRCADRQPARRARDPGHAVLAAYQRAEDRLGAQQPGCRVSVPLLAAIRRVETNHARGGNVDAHGAARMPTIGPQLNGGPGMATIPDTDRRRYDGDPMYDQAVGPMQLIPSTWAR